MNRREALTWIFGSAAAPLVEAADVNVLPKEVGGPLMLVVSFTDRNVEISENQAKAIRDKIGALVPGVPVVVLAPGMRLEAIYRTPPACADFELECNCKYPAEDGSCCSR